MQSKYVKRKQFCYQFILSSLQQYTIFFTFYTTQAFPRWLKKICIKYSTKFINTSGGTTLLSLMNSFPQHGHQTFTIMQSKLFEFRCASWWTPCTRNRFPRIATSSEKVNLAQLFLQCTLVLVHYSTTHKYCFFSQNFVILSPAPRSTSDKTAP
jgi:hypothetical protein